MSLGTLSKHCYYHGLIDVERFNTGVEKSGLLSLPEDGGKFFGFRQRLFSQSEFDPFQCAVPLFSIFGHPFA
jgi:hypothetical protein